MRKIGRPKVTLIKTFKGDDGFARLTLSQNEKNKNGGGRWTDGIRTVKWVLEQQRGWL
jgi:hypothetical protein